MKYITSEDIRILKNQFWEALNNDPQNIKENHDLFSTFKEKLNEIYVSKTPDKEANIILNYAKDVASYVEETNCDYEDWKEKEQANNREKEFLLDISDFCSSLDQRVYPSIELKEVLEKLYFSYKRLYFYELRNMEQYDPKEVDFEKENNNKLMKKFEELVILCRK